MFYGVHFENVSFKQASANFFYKKTIANNSSSAALQSVAICGCAVTRGHIHQRASASLVMDTNLSFTLFSCATESSPFDFSQPFKNGKRKGHS